MTTALKNFGWQKIPCEYGVARSFSYFYKFGSFGGTAGQFIYPMGVAYAPNGTKIAVSDTAKNRIQVFDIVHNTVTHSVTFGGTGPGVGGVGTGPGQFNTPTGIAFSPDSSRILVSDMANNRLQLLGIVGNTITYLSMYGASGTLDGQFNTPQSVAFSADGSRIVVADSYNHRVQFLGISGDVITHQVSYGVYGSADGQFASVLGVALSGDGTRLYVADADNSRIQLFHVYGNTITHLSSYGSNGAGGGQFSTPYGVAINHDSTQLAVSEWFGDRIQVFAISGTALTHCATVGALGSGVGLFNNPRGLVFSPNGANIAVADAANNRIQIL